MKKITGFHHRVEKWRDGKLVEVLHDAGNLIPEEGVDWILTEAFINNNWYIALLDTSFTPADSDTYASVMGTSNSESTDYDQTTRPQWNPGSIYDNTGGVRELSNSASPATFTMGGNDSTIYGDALVSSSVKGDTTSSETLISLAMWDTANTSIADGEEIKVIITKNLDEAA